MKFRNPASGYLCAAAALLLGGCSTLEPPRSRATPTILDGTWNLISVDNVQPDGTRSPRHGSKPAGQLIFDGEGHYSLIVLTMGTPEEYKAAIEGDNCDYGRYLVNAADHSVTFYMDHASHRELEGSSHTRYFMLTGNLLRYTTMRLDASGRTARTYGEVVYRRAASAGQERH